MIETATLFAPLPELLRLLRRGKLSPVRLTEAYLDRIERHDGALRSVTALLGERALERARQVQRELDAGLSRSAVHGIPYLAKDLFSAEGAPTTWGSRAFTGRHLPGDATVIRRLHDAGSLLIGKTSMTEFAGGPPPASATGPCRNPWDTARWAGGSSSGSAAAVAAGFAPFALGTETWGSIMTPASYCGVTGFRPTAGRISRAGVMALSWSMDKVGILARTAQDCGTVFALIGGEDEEDGMSVDAPFRPSWTRVLERARGLTIAVVPEDYERWGDADVQSGRDRVAEVFRGAGAEIRAGSLPDHPWEDVAATIISAEQASAFEEFVRAGGVSTIIDPGRRAELLGGGRIPAVDYLRCQRLRRRMQEDLPALFGGADLLLGSATLRTAPPVEADLATIFAGGNVIEAAENLLGLPGAAFPCGSDRNGLPVGAKIIGRPFADDLVLEAVHLVQTLTTWHTRRPPI